MTVAQTKARRRFWKKIDKRYRGRIKDEATQKRKAIEKLKGEQERMVRKGQKKKKK